MKFKNNKELILFICLNIFGSPFTWIVAYVLLNWYGVIGSLIISIISYKFWKQIDKKNSKLIINPSFTFGTKKYRLF